MRKQAHKSSQIQEGLLYKYILQKRLLKITLEKILLEDLYLTGGTMKVPRCASGTPEQEAADGWEPFATQNSTAFR